MRIVARRRRRATPTRSSSRAATTSSSTSRPTAGGTDTGPRPTQLLAASLAGCTAITVEMYAERKGWDVGAIEVDVDVAYDGARRRPASRSALKLPASSTTSSASGC